ncbi:DUF5677 domain-containing protein [Ottowia sp.]|uniref:DUF6988 family protein n=1 Tax=Ottowia sp. TaxID=1898956 RepID=UPI002627926F|nr:DUF5677 domain-containing protein [Ottowia sp.]
MNTEPTVKDVLSAEHLREASAFGEVLRYAVHEKVLPANLRVRASASCFGIACDHHDATILLLKSGLNAPCFALLRVTYEAYVRGQWLMNCATDRQIDDFLNGAEPPKIKAMLEALSSYAEVANEPLEQIHRFNWSALNGYTHTGGIHVQRWNTATSIEAHYSGEELLEVLRFSEIFATLAAAGVLQLADDLTAAARVLEGFQGRGAK